MSLDSLSQIWGPVQAIAYALSNWQALIRYAGDGDLEIDNNGAERSLRGVAVGRKNWLFFGSDYGRATPSLRPHPPCCIPVQSVRGSLTKFTTLIRLPICGASSNASALILSADLPICSPTSGRRRDRRLLSRDLPNSPGLPNHVWRTQN